MKICVLNLHSKSFANLNCKLLLNIPVPGCQRQHMVCKTVFRFFLMQVSMSCPPMTDLVPCVLWKGTVEDVFLPQQKAKEFFVFKQIKVIIPHFQSHSLDFFLLHLLPLTVFLFFLQKWCGNFSSDVTGNRDLFQWQQILVFRYCITAAQSWLLARDHDKWLEAPGGTPPPPPPPLPDRQSPPQTLPNVSHELKPAKARCSGFLTSGWKNLPLTLTEKKNNMAIFLSYHSYYSEICVSMCSFCPTQEYVYVVAIMQWGHKALHHRNICISLLSIIIEPSPSPTGGVQDWKE